MRVENFSQNFAKEVKATDFKNANNNEAASVFATKSSAKATDIYAQMQELNAMEEQTVNYSSNDGVVPTNTNSGKYEADYTTEGGKAVKFAQQFIGYNAADGSADLFFSISNVNKGQSSSNLAWCGAFAKYALQESGIQVPSWFKNIYNPDYCPEVANAAINSGAVIDRSQAKAGDIILFDQSANGEKDHIGIVTGVDEDGTVHTIEGNTWDDFTGAQGVVAEHSYRPGYEAERGWAPFMFCKIAQ